MPEYEYSIAKGWDTHTLAGYRNFVTSTPQEALELEGTDFLPSCDDVVRREVGTEKWSYHPEDQVYDLPQKTEEWRVAQAERQAQREMWRPKKSSALPNNRRARSYGPFIRHGDSLHVWLYEKGLLNIPKTFPEEEK